MWNREQSHNSDPTAYLRDSVGTGDEEMKNKLDIREGDLWMCSAGILWGKHRKRALFFIEGDWSVTDTPFDRLGRLYTIKPLYRLRRDDEQRNEEKEKT